MTVLQEMLEEEQVAEDGTEGMFGSDKWSWRSLGDKYMQKPRRRVGLRGQE